MPKPRVYIETTIPSFYYETRDSAQLCVMRDFTRTWWNHYRHMFSLCISQAVLDELAPAPEPKRSSALALIGGIDKLEVTDQVNNVTQAYIERKIMPFDALGDALHLALASVHRVDYLLTWNCRHLANANKFRQIGQINTTMGLFVPVLTTPQGLLPEAPDGQAL